MEIIRNNRSEIPSVAAEYVGIPQEQIKFEELVALQTQLMQLLPFSVYVCADINTRIKYDINEAKKHRAHINQEERILLSRYEASERQLQNDFGVTHKKVTSPTESTLEEAIKLFGEEFRFIEKIRAKDD